jgi:hypothetical protein
MDLRLPRVERLNPRGGNYSGFLVVFLSSFRDGHPQPIWVATRINEPSSEAVGLGSFSTSPGESYIFVAPGRDAQSPANRERLNCSRQVFAEVLDSSHCAALDHRKQSAGSCSPESLPQVQPIGRSDLPAERPGRGKHDAGPCLRVLGRVGGIRSLFALYY